MGYMHALDDILELTDLSDELRRKIMWDNPARLYALD
jgi:predicted TIM-barrel fold metal-dependent hydrolase